MSVDASSLIFLISVSVSLVCSVFAISMAISLCTLKISVISLSKVSDHICTSLFTSISCATIRTLLSAFRTVPSSIISTPSSSPITGMLLSLSLYWMVDVLDLTLRSAIFARLYRMSSVIPSLKYSCSGSSLNDLKGRTAIEFPKCLSGLTSFGIKIMPRIIKSRAMIDPAIIRVLLSFFVFGTGPVVFSAVQTCSCSRCLAESIISLIP